MKTICAMLILGSIAMGCSKNIGTVDQLKSEVPGGADHKISDQYSAIVTFNGLSSPDQGTHWLEYNIDSNNNISGHQNMTGARSGFSAIVGTKNGDMVTFQSTECAGDTFSGSLNLQTGSGSFSGVICGYAFSNGSISNARQEY